MRNFIIEFNELSNSKQDDIRNSIRADLEMDLAAMGKSVDILIVSKMVEDIIRLTFNCQASLEIDTEYLVEKYEDEINEQTNQ